MKSFEARARRLAGHVNHQQLIRTRDRLEAKGGTEPARLWRRAVEIQDENRSLESAMALSDVLGDAVYDARPAGDCQATAWGWSGDAPARRLPGLLGIPRLHVQTEASRPAYLRVLWLQGPREQSVAWMRWCPALLRAGHPLLRRGREQQRQGSNK
jgi:hypothetical protein